MTVGDSSFQSYKTIVEAIMSYGGGSRDRILITASKWLIASHDFDGTVMSEENHVIRVEHTGCEPPYRIA